VVYIPDSVERELNHAAEHVSATRAVLDADWIRVHRSTSGDFSEAFAYYANRLVVGDKNLGECGVLAMGQIYKCEVVIDDATPKQLTSPPRPRQHRMEDPDQRVGPPPRPPPETATRKINKRLNSHDRLLAKDQG
jgi:hypothetical protein